MTRTGRLDDARDLARKTLAEANADLDLPEPAKGFPYWFGATAKALEILLNDLDAQDGEPR